MSSNNILTVLGVAIVSIGLVYAFIKRLRATKLTNGNKNMPQNEVPRAKPENTNSWQGVSPPNSKFKVMSKRVNSIPSGTQVVSLEYDVNGHAYPLNLQGSVTRLEIHFSYQINNPMKAVLVGREYAMNFLPTHFLIKARQVLESFSFTGLQAHRETAEKEITLSLAEYFDEFGFTLLTVTLGSVSKINYKV